MDIEFHYYMTYLIASRAGFRPAEAAVLAQAAQEIDDNHIPIAVSKGTPAEYESIISQTMDIPLYHFTAYGSPGLKARSQPGGRPWSAIAMVEAAVTYRPCSTVRSTICWSFRT
jgi:hypothetical protein